jgi:hypothetical protein
MATARGMVSGIESSLTRLLRRDSEVPVILEMYGSLMMSCTDALRREEKYITAFMVAGWNASLPLLEVGLRTSRLRLRLALGGGRVRVALHWVNSSFWVQGRWMDVGFFGARRQSTPAK